MKPYAVIAAAALLAAGPASAKPALDNAVLAKVQVVEFDMDHNVPYRCDPPPAAGEECMSIGGFVKVKLRIVAVYAGRLSRNFIDGWFPMDAMPVSRTFYAIGSLDAPDELRIVDWNQSMFGFCIGDGARLAGGEVARAALDLANRERCRNR